MNGHTATRVVPVDPFSKTVPSRFNLVTRHYEMDDLTSCDIPTFVASLLSSDAHFGGPDQMAVGGPVRATGALIAVPLNKILHLAHMGRRRIIYRGVT